MATRFEMALLAELASLNMAIMKALQGNAAIVRDSGGDPNAYLDRLLTAGLRDLELTRYPDIAESDLFEFHEMAKARYTDLISGIRLS